MKKRLKKTVYLSNKAHMRIYHSVQSGKNNPKYPLTSLDYHYRVKETQEKQNRLLTKEEKKRIYLNSRADNNYR